MQRPLIALCIALLCQQAPMVAAEAKPNVVLIIVDDLNDWTGWLGGHSQARTPNMDRLARMGMRFTNAHASYALCNPSRAALMTGMGPATSGVFGNEQDWRRSINVAGKLTIPEFFKTSGYTTAAGGKIFHANHGGPEARLAGWHGGRRGFELDVAWDTRFPQPGVQLAEAPVHTGQNFNGLDIWHWDWGPIDVTEDQTEDGRTVAWAARYLAQAHQTQPFFLAVGLYKPHSPWYAPRAYFDERPLDQVKLPPVKEDDLDDVPAFAKSHLNGGDNYHQQIVARGLWPSAVRAYLACITFADTQVGKLLAAIEQSSAAANTIVCLTSDHGWYLGEKQMWHKGRLWERATHVPLTIYAPGVTRANSVSAKPVSLIDLYPTLCDLAHLKRPAHLDGESLVPLLRDSTTQRARPAITTMGGDDRVSYAARTDRWRYIRYADASEELYDHNADPNEWTNLATRPDHDELKKSLAAFFPTEWHNAHRSLEQITPVTKADGSVQWALQPGDELPARSSPQIAGRGFSIDARFDYTPAVDQDSTLLAHGTDQNGWALHLVAGAPTLSVFISGHRTALSLDALQAGPAELRAAIPGDGRMLLAVPDVKEKVLTDVFPGGFPVQPGTGLQACESFGPLKAKTFPNSTPFDGRVQQLQFTVLPSR